MFINAKLNENMINKPNIRYSQTSLNSTQNSDLDYNLYCFSQGYENKEKGFWRGVLRNKNIDFDLKLDKEWNRRIELEDSLALSDAQSQISNLDTEIISIMNEGDMGWDKNLFQNFKKKQIGVKKQKNKEWLLSNGIKRAQGIVVELRTQNYKQFEENEKNKKLKKIQNEKPPQQKQELILDNSRYQYSEKAKKYNQAEYNQIKNYAGSDTKKTGASSTYNTLSDTKAYTKTVIKKNQYDVRSPLELSNKKYNKYQRSPRIEPMNNYGIKRQEIKIGQNYNNSNNITNKKKSDDQYVQAFTLDDRPKNLVRLEVSVEKKKKTSIERKPEPRQHDRVTSSKKKRKVSLDKYGKPITNTSRVNIDTSKKKAPKERLDNISRLEISAEKKKKTSIERKPEHRQHERVTSSKKKRKVSLDKYGKPLTNTSRVNINTSKKKEQKERMENRSRLEISVEGKKKQKEGRKPSSRKHYRYSSSKKKRISVDSQGRPLTNTSRLNVDTSKKKAPKERVENRSRLEVSVEGKKKQKEGRKPSSRKHYRYSSSKKKRISVDRKGRPLTNTSRVNIDTSTKKAPKERVENRSRLEVSVGKKKQSTERKPESRKHSKIYMNKNKTSTYQTSENKYILKTEPKQSYTSQKIIQDNKYAQYKRIKPQTIQQEIKPVYQYQKRQDISSSKYTSQIQQPLNKTYLTDKKEKIVEQKPYVRKFDLGIKEDKSKTKQLQQTSYNQKLNRQSQLGNYETKIIEKAHNLGRLEVSAEKKKKTSIERKPEPRQHDRVTSSKKKRKVSLDKYGKPITNTSRVNIDTSKKKVPKERLDNISRLEISAEKKNKKSIERKPEPRQHERVTSSKKKRKVSLDKYGKPLTNTSRVNIDTSKKKAPKERMENRSRLEISVEGKKKQKEGRKPSSRKHYRYSSSKKKRISVDSQGRPLTNTSRLNVDTSKKKAPKERVENRSRLEVSVEGKKKQKEGRKPSSRKHYRYSSSKKKRISVDSQGRPLANTSRVNIDTSTKKAPKERVENRSRLEVSAEKKKQKEVRKTSSRKHSKIQIIKNNRKESLDKDGNPITNVNRLRVGIKEGRVKYAQLEDFDKYEDKSHVRHQTFQTDSNKYNKYNQTKQYKPQPQTKPQTQYTIIKTPIKQQENNNKNIIQHKRHLTEQISTQKLSEASKAFFTNKRQYERIKKDNQSNKETHKTQYSKGTESSYSYMKYGVSTAATNISEKKPRFDKGIDITKTSLFGQKDQTKTQSQTNRNYSYNKDFKGLITNKSYYNNTQREKPNTNGITKTNTNSNINKREKVVSENKTLDFSKYYKKYNEDKPKDNKKQTTYQKPIDNVNGKEIYEYIPTPKSEKYNNKNKNISQTQKKNQKEFSIDLTKYNGIFNKSNNKIQPQAIEVSEETRSSDNKRNKSTVPNNRFSFSQKPNSLVYFKLQFLNTKQVVEKFWNSIDNGELSISMFADNLRNSSKLSNFVSPEKNRMSKISTSSKLGKKINFSNTSELMSGRIRQSYKA